MIEFLRPFEVAAGEPTTPADTGMRRMLRRDGWPATLAFAHWGFPGPLL